MGLTGCAVRSFRVEADAQWPGGMPLSTYRYWAKVDSANAVAESNEADNVIVSLVLTAPPRSPPPPLPRSSGSSPLS